MTCCIAIIVRAMVQYRWKITPGYAYDLQRSHILPLIVPIELQPAFTKIKLSAITSFTKFIMNGIPLNAQYKPLIVTAEVFAFSLF